MQRILIGPESEILIGRVTPDPLLPERHDRRIVAVFTQPGASSIAQGLAERLAERGYRVGTHVMADRDGAKSLEALDAAYSHLAELGLGRGDTVVAVGGGAVTDSAGFVAATWMRGLEAVYVPTTLLGAVDAAVGGKTAVNLAGKNLVGVFRHPRRVVIDLTVLDGLPASLKKEGAAEIIKVGMLSDPEIVESYRREGLAADLESVVPAAVAIKADFVNADFEERGDRALLNLGHTVGHGLEYASTLSHGEAVSLGLMAEMAISEKLLGFDQTDLVREALENTGLPVNSPVPFDRQEVVRLIGLDKKRSAGNHRMALVERLGSARLVDVSEQDIAVGLDAIGA